jgi:hypothetical protein
MQYALALHPLAEATQKPGTVLLVSSDNPALCKISGTVWPLPCPAPRKSNPLPVRRVSLKLQWRRDVRDASLDAMPGPASVSIQIRIGVAAFTL